MRRSTALSYYWAILTVGASLFGLCAIFWRPLGRAILLVTSTTVGGYFTTRAILSLVPLSGGPAAAPYVFFVVAGLLTPAGGLTQYLLVRRLCGLERGKPPMAMPSRSLGGDPQSHEHDEKIMGHGEPER